MVIVSFVGFEFGLENLTGEMALVSREKQMDLEMIGVAVAGEL